MLRKQPIEIGEWYHCYNRGVDKRDIFLTSGDYERFLALLFLCNSTSRKHLSNLSSTRSITLTDVLRHEREGMLVDIGVFCLMPNHFHLLLREVVPSGISAFMRRVCTGYSMYFNILNERSGALFSGRFKSKHVFDDRYLKRVSNYIHANPAELREKGWKSGIIQDPVGIQEFLSAYPYSSLPDYMGTMRPEAAITNVSISKYYSDMAQLSVRQLLTDAIDFAGSRPDIHTKDGP